MIESIGEVNAGQVGALVIVQQLWNMLRRAKEKSKTNDLLGKMQKNQLSMLETQREILRLSEWLYEAHNQKTADGSYTWVIREEMGRVMASVQVIVARIEQSLALSTPSVKKELEDLSDDIKELKRVLDHIDHNHCA